MVEVLGDAEAAGVRELATPVLEEPEQQDKDSGQVQEPSHYK